MCVTPRLQICQASQRNASHSQRSSLIIYYATVIWLFIKQMLFYADQSKEWRNKILWGDKTEHATTFCTKIMLQPLSKPQTNFPWLRAGTLQIAKSSIVWRPSFRPSSAFRVPSMTILLQRHNLWIWKDDFVAVLIFWTFCQIVMSVTNYVAWGITSTIRRNPIRG